MNRGRNSPAQWLKVWGLDRASLAGEEILVSIPQRTLRDWKKKYRNAEQMFGNGYLGLVPKSTKGNRNSKLPSLSIDILGQSIAEKYETPEQKSRQIVYLDYEASCKEKGVLAASYVTFCEYVKKRSKHEQTLKRQGKRAAYNHEMFYWNLEQDTPRHGERPFHIAHIDHTELDIELIDTVTGKNLGRPWLTILIDAFSRRILAVYLTFSSPSKISCMMTLRECVRKHGRLPQIIIVDGGKEFASVYFESLLACYEVTRKTRPPAKSRFGSIIERLFGTTNKQFVHNLIGNTQITKNVRQVTKSNNPKNRAIWTLPRLFDRLCEWAYNVYDQTEHSTLNQAPQEAFAQGMLNAGERRHRLIPFNEEFRLMTLPGTLKGTAKIDYNRGVKINKIFYWSDEFRNPEVVGSRVPVRYDPFDMGIAYACIKGKWRECRSQHFRVFRNRSEREIYLATEELRKKQGSNSVTTKVLAKFLESVEAEEILLKQRMNDREQRSVLTLINGTTMVGKSSGETFIDEPDKLIAESAGNVIVFPSSEKTEEESDTEDTNFEMYKSL